MRVQRPTGFTLVELLFAMAVVVVLAALAYPSFQMVVLKGRRTEALATLMKARTLQERYRADHASYADNATLGLSNSEFYDYQIQSPTSGGFDVIATAKGAQTADEFCQVLKLSVQALNETLSSGPDEKVGNAVALNRTCWRL